MNNRLIKLLIMSLVGLISAYSCQAKWYHQKYAPQIMAEKVEMLQDRFNQLFNKSDNICCNSFEADPRIIEYQGYKVWPRQRRKIMRAKLESIKKTLLSFPPASIKKEAIENLERRIMLLQKAS